MSLKRNNNEIIKELSGLYPHLDFSKFSYSGINEKSIVICPIHGEFEAIYSNLIISKLKIGCKKCCNILEHEEAINNLKIKYPNYNYSKFVYVNYNTKSTVICPIHGEFNETYDNLMYNLKNGCKECTNKNKSSYEKEIVEYIRTFYNNKIEENNRTIILNEYTGKYLELDIYLPDINLAIEFNGVYWHSDKVIKKKKIGFNSAEEYHKYKFDKCNDQDIKLIHINEEYYIKNKNEILNNIKQDILSL